MTIKKRKHSSPGKRGKWSGSSNGKPKELKSQGPGGIHQLTIYGAAVLVVAIISGKWLNNSNESKSKKIIEDTSYRGVISDNLTVEESFGTFLEAICDEEATTPEHDKRSSDKAWCGNGKIEATHRTFQASGNKGKPVRRGDVLAEIPRSLQIWELDALNSDFFRTENLLKARHELTENPLAGGAFLAAFIAHERKRLEKETRDDAEHDGGNDSTDAVRRLYFRSLPDGEEMNTHHPLLRDRVDLQELLGVHSWNYAVVVMYQEMIVSEYKALITASPVEFKTNVTLKLYREARVHVLSRSFNPGPEACSAGLNAIFSPSDIERIQTDWGMKSSETLFETGCHAMVPILDMLNSHPQPNAVYHYNLEKEAFVISAKKRISPHWELMNSYGKFSDAHLYAKFGFNNGDGSGYTQASVAIFHRTLDAEIGQEFTLIPHTVRDAEANGDESLPIMKRIPSFQTNELKRYLTYDDGYEDCIQQELHPEAYELKKLKWMHLAKIANNIRSWVVTLQPRVTGSKPKMSSDMQISEVPPQVDPRKIRMDLTPLMDTCRLIALTIEDLDGNSMQILKDNLGNGTYVVPTASHALEYRSLMLLARLAGTALMQYHPVNLQEEYDNVFELNKQGAFGNSTWAAAQLRLGEMQALHAVSGTAIAFARELVKDMDTDNLPTAYKIREKSCPKEFTDPLNADS